MNGTQVTFFARQNRRHQDAEMQLDLRRNNNCVPLGWIGVSAQRPVILRVSPMRMQRT